MSPSNSNAPPTNSQIALPFLRLERRESDPSRVSNIVASDGNFIRRLVAADRQIYLQDSSQDELGDFLITYIKDGLHRGEPLIGYTLLADARAVCVRATGDNDEAGWMAYPDKRSLPTSLSDALPDIPRRRLVAGANTHGHSGRFHLTAALEERGDTLRDISLLDHVEEITLHATRSQRGQVENLRLARRYPTAEKLNRTSPRQMQFTISIDEELFRNLHLNQENIFWLGVQFSTKLVCLPEPWRKLYLKIRPR